MIIAEAITMFLRNVFCSLLLSVSSLEVVFDSGTYIHRRSVPI